MGERTSRCSISCSLFTTFDNLLRWSIRPMKKTIKGEPVVRCLYTSGWFTDRVVFSWIQTLAASVILGYCWNKKSEGVIFSTNHAAHFPHSCSHFSGSLWTNPPPKKQTFAIVIAHFQFSSQTRVDGYSCQHVSAVCTRLWTFYT